MIDPTDWASAIKRLPVKLKHVRDLEAFEGPLLSEFKSSKGDTFVYYWCDNDAETNRWLVIRTPKSQLLRYLVRRTDLLDLVDNCPDQTAYVVDIDSSFAHKTVWFANVEDIPADYKPSAGAKFDLDSQVHANGKQFQDVALDEHAGLEKVSEYPRKYLQAYGFLSAFGPSGDAKNLKIHLNLTSGFVFGTLFKQVQANAAPAKRAHLTEVAYASPGYLRFTVEPTIAAAVRESIAAYIKNTTRVRELIKTLTSWSNESKATKDVTETKAAGLVRSLGTSLRFNGGDLVQRSASVRIAAKAAVSYARRVKFLAEDEADGSALLVGMTEISDEMRREVLGDRGQPDANEDSLKLDQPDSDEVD